MKTIVNVKTEIVGYHRWPDAQGDVTFLANKHRHKFHIQLGVFVSDPDRQVEFFTCKKTITSRFFSSGDSGPFFVEQGGS